MCKKYNRSAPNFKISFHLVMWFKWFLLLSINIFPGFYNFSRKKNNSTNSLFSQSPYEWPLLSLLFWCPDAPGQTFNSSDSTQTLHLLIIAPSSCLCQSVQTICLSFLSFLSVFFFYPESPSTPKPRSYRKADKDEHR